MDEHGMNEAAYQDDNPSSWKARIPICILACIAFSICIYLSLYQLGFMDKVWDPVFGSGTEKVLNSSIAVKAERWVHIPDAALGGLAYLLDIILVWVGDSHRWHAKPWLVIAFGINTLLVGLVSAALVVLQGSVIGAWCFLCLITAALSFVIIFMSHREVWASVVHLYHQRKTPGSHHTQDIIKQNS